MKVSFKDVAVVYDPEFSISKITQSLVNKTDIVQYYELKKDGSLKYITWQFDSELIRAVTTEQYESWSQKTIIAIPSELELSVGDIYGHTGM